MIQPVMPRQTEGVRDSRGRFIKGVSGNLKGPPRGYKRSAFVEMEKAIAEYQKENGTSYWKSATILAMELAKKGNTTLLCKVLDKFIPTKVEVHDDENPFEKLPIVKIYADGRN